MKYDFKDFPISTVETKYGTIVNSSIGTVFQDNVCFNTQLYDLITDVMIYGDAYMEIEK